MSPAASPDTVEEARARDGSGRLSGVHFVPGRPVRDQPKIRIYLPIYECNLLYSNMIVFEHMCLAVRIWPPSSWSYFYLDTM